MRRRFVGKFCLCHVLDSVLDEVERKFARNLESFSPDNALKPREHTTDKVEQENDHVSKRIEQKRHDAQRKIADKRQWIPQVVAFARVWCGEEIV